MNKLDKLVEDKIKAKGWIKLLPTEKCQTNQPHRFRYADGNNDFVSIIQYGSLVGVFAAFNVSYTGNATNFHSSANWREKYKQVDWDTPNCDCEQCQLTAGLEELQYVGQCADSFVRRSEGLSSNATVDITNLQIEQEDNNWKTVSFSYKVSNDLQVSAEL